MEGRRGDRGESCGHLIRIKGIECRVAVGKIQFVFLRKLNFGNDHAVLIARVRSVHPVVDVKFRAVRHGDIFFAERNVCGRGQRKILLERFGQEQFGIFLVDLRDCVIVRGGGKGRHRRPRARQDECGRQNQTEYRFCTHDKPIITRARAKDKRLSPKKNCERLKKIWHSAPICHISVI